jgi:hypothetical protein
MVEIIGWAFELDDCGAILVVVVATAVVGFD